MHCIHRDTFIRSILLQYLRVVCKKLLTYVACMIEDRDYTVNHVLELVYYYANNVLK